MIPRLLSRRRTTRSRAASDAYILDVAARCAAGEREYERRAYAFDHALDQFATEQPTRVVLADHLNAVSA